MAVDKLTLFSGDELSKEFTEHQHFSFASNQWVGGVLVLQVLDCSVTSCDMMYVCILFQLNNYVNSIYEFPYIN